MKPVVVCVVWNAAGVFVGEGFHRDAYMLWCLRYRNTEWMIILTTAMTALHGLAFALTGERSYQLLRGWGVGNGTARIYYPIITPMGGGGSKTETNKGERGINPQERWIRESKKTKNVEKQDPNLHPNSDVYFIWGGRCAGSTTSQCYSGPFSLAVLLT